MRNIRFRGKNENGFWFEGHLVHKTDMYFIFLDGYRITQDDFFGQVVSEETVGQFTGLQDKNGNDIFEGDIVTGLFWGNYSVNSVVEFRDGSFGLRWLRGGTTEFNAFPTMCNVEYEVIGNIYDNPELLEV